MSLLPKFLVSINGLQTHAVYDCESAISSMSLHFCTTLSTNPSHFLSSSESLPFITFTILTSTGSFTSLASMTMQISKEQIEGVVFGRDWFNCCSADIPFPTPSRVMDLIEPESCLCFGISPKSCIQARVSLGLILIIFLLWLTNKLSRKLNRGCRT